MLTLKTYIYRGVASFALACVLVVVVYIFIQYLLQAESAVDEIDAPVTDNYDTKTSSLESKGVYTI